MEIRVCLVDAVIALAAIGSDKREALRGNMLKHVDLRVRIRLVKTKQRPLQFESPTLFSSPTQSAISQKSFEILENRGKFALFSLVLRASARRTREASVYTELARRPLCLHRLDIHLVALRSKRARWCPNRARPCGVWLAALGRSGLDIAGRPGQCGPYREPDLERFSIFSNAFGFANVVGRFIP